MKAELKRRLVFDRKDYCPIVTFYTAQEGAIEYSFYEITFSFETICLGISNQNMSWYWDVDNVDGKMVAFDYIPLGDNIPYLVSSISKEKFKKETYYYKVGQKPVWSDRITIGKDTMKFKLIERSKFDTFSKACNHIGPMDETFARGYNSGLAMTCYDPRAQIPHGDTKWFVKVFKYDASEAEAKDQKRSHAEWAFLRHSDNRIHAVVKPLKVAYFDITKSTLGFSDLYDLIIKIYGPYLTDEPLVPFKHSAR